MERFFKGLVNELSGREPDGLVQIVGERVVVRDKQLFLRVVLRIGDEEQLHNVNCRLRDKGYLVTVRAGNLEYATTGLVLLILKTFTVA